MTEAEHTTGTDDLAMELSQRKRARPIEPFDWLFDEPNFQCWRDHRMQQRTVLWVNGPTGSGKTSLAQRVTEVLKQSPDGLPLACYLCEATTTPRLMILSILEQLSLDPELSSKGSEILLGILCKLKTESESAPYTSYASWDLFETALTAVQSCILIIDGLDEIPDDFLDDAGFNVGERLINLTTSRPGLLTLYVSSIDETDTRTIFDGHMSITLTPEKTLEDVHRFCSDEVLRYPNLVPYQDMIVKEIVQKAHGNFRWAAMALQWLSMEDVSPTGDGATVSLKRLPSKLNALYESSLLRIFSDRSALNVAIRTTTLSWVLNCVRPPSLTEIEVAINIHDNIRITDIKSSIMEACGSLIKFKNDLVKPIHTSLLMYLRYGYNVIAEASELYGPQAHDLITTTCLRYLGHPAFARDIYSPVDKPSLAANYPLLEYATLYWVHHFSKADVFQPRLEEQMTDFFGTHNFFHWVDRFLSTFLPRSVHDITPKPTHSARIDYLFQLKSQLATAFSEFPNRMDAIDQQITITLVNFYQRMSTTLAQTPNVLLNIRRLLDISEIYSHIPDQQSSSSSTITSALDLVSTHNLLSSPDPTSKSLALSVLQAHASSLIQSNKHTEAQSQLETLLALYAHDLPHPLSREHETNKFHILTSLGEIHMRLNDPQSASIYLTESLALSPAIHGSTSPALLACKTALAWALRQLNRTDEAASLLADLTRLLHNHVGFDTELSREAVSGLPVLAQIREAQRMWRDAVQIYEVLATYWADNEDGGMDCELALWAWMKALLAREGLLDASNGGGGSSSSTTTTRSSGRSDDDDDDDANPEGLEQLRRDWEQLVEIQERVLGLEHPDARVSQSAIERLAGRKSDEG